MSKKIAFIYGLVFFWVVIAGFLPILSTWTWDNRILLKLFQISMMDDIMHGVTAIVFLLAAYLWTTQSKLAILTFGGYYMCDALFYLLMAPFAPSNLIVNIIVNIPHAVISISMFSLLYLYGRDKKLVI